MHKEILKRLSKRFEAYDELAATLDDALLKQKIEVPKHKSLAEHLWCVIGARESYAKALSEGAWAGFACSMTSYGAGDYRLSLRQSGKVVQEAIAGVEDWTEESHSLLASLAEHEVMHEGQIIRHMYALERTLPESWFWA